MHVVQDAGCTELVLLYEGMWEQGRRQGRGTQHYRNGEWYEGGQQGGAGVRWLLKIGVQASGILSTVPSPAGKVHTYDDVSPLQPHSRRTAVTADTDPGRCPLHRVQYRSMWGLTAVPQYLGPHSSTAVCGASRQYRFASQAHSWRCPAAGDWAADLRHGQGSQHFNNGDVYSGSWDLDHRTGRGTLYLASGDIFVGAFCQDKQHGMGCMYLVAAGRRMVGEWLQVGAGCAVVGWAVG
jgi:hypothetical protein